MGKEINENNVFDYLADFLVVQKLINHSLLPDIQKYNSVKAVVEERLKELYPEKTDDEIKTMICLNL